MSWFSKRKKKRKKENNDIDWKTISEKGKDYEFKGRFLGKEINLSPKKIQFIAFIIAAVLVIFMVRNVFYVFTKIEIPNVSRSNKEYLDENKIFIDSNIRRIKNHENRLNSHELRINSILKKKAYDSLIDNQILSPETSAIIEKKYPDSICGC